MTSVPHMYQVFDIYLREFDRGVFGADRWEHHAAAALLPVGGGGQALGGGELEGVNRPNNLRKFNDAKDGSGGGGGRGGGGNRGRQLQKILSCTPPAVRCVCVLLSHLCWTPVYTCRYVGASAVVGHTGRGRSGRPYIHLIKYLMKYASSCHTHQIYPFLLHIQRLKI